MAGSMASTIPRFLGLFGLLVLFSGFVVIVAGLAKIQKTTNALGPADQIPADTANQYVSTFTQSLITPYPASHGFQFSYIWFIIFFNLFNFLLCAAILLLPRVLFVGRAAALSLLAIATTLTIAVVNNLQFMHRSTFAKTAYGKRNIDVTFAGAILVVIGDILLILALGSWAHDHTHSSTTSYNNTNKRNAEPVIATTTV